MNNNLDCFTTYQSSLGYTSIFVDSEREREREREISYKK